MAIRFPDFKNSRCMAIGACGTLETEDPEILGLIGELRGDQMVGSYRSGKVKAFVRILWGETSLTHVHIDIYRKEAFAGELPTTTHSRRDIERYLGKIEGLNASTYAFGRYFLTIDDLPEDGLIRSTQFESREDDLSVKMSGAEFAIKGAPVRALNWQLFDRDRKVKIDIDAMVKTTIGRNYLTDQLELIDAAFRLFVLGDGPHAAHQGE